RRFVQGTGQDQSPEALHGARCLTVGPEPVPKRWVGIGRTATQTRQAPGDAKLFSGAQVVRAPKAPRQVKRCRQRIRLKSAQASVRGHEVEVRLRLEQVGDANRAAEMGKVRAAAHANVLAGIDELTARRIVKRSGPPA